jgi:hypothetical protein
MTTGVLPSDWKLANITALYKKGKKTAPTNYRPISLTSVVCKVLESILCDALMEHLNGNHLLTDKQYGFRKGRSSTIQMLHVTDTWTKLIDQSDSIDVIYTDFQKAFDTVPHRRLLQKLMAYGIGDNVLSWIESFLTGRSQRVVVDGVPSPWSDVISGIPRGTVLGPILFLVYINDIVDDLQCSPFLFADDMKLFCCNSKTANNMQYDLDIISDWTNRWLLKLNLDKCKLVCINTNSKTVKNHLYLSSDNKLHLLNSSDAERDLGIIIDNKLNFRKHILEISKKANKMLGLIKRNFRHLDVNSFLKLYKTIVRSQLEYAQSVWQPYKKIDINCLETIQRRATKLLPHLRRLPYSERLRQLGLPSLVYRRKRGDMIEAFKILNGFYDTSSTPHL